MKKETAGLKSSTKVLTRLGRAPERSYQGGDEDKVAIAKDVTLLQRIEEHLTSQLGHLQQNNERLSLALVRLGAPYLPEAERSEDCPEPDEKDTMLSRMHRIIQLMSDANIELEYHVARLERVV